MPCLQGHLFPSFLCSLLKGSSDCLAFPFPHNDLIPTHSQFPAGYCDFLPVTFSCSVCFWWTFWPCSLWFPSKGSCDFYALPQQFNNNHNNNKLLSCEHCFCYWHGDKCLDESSHFFFITPKQVLISLQMGKVICWFFQLYCLPWHCYGLVWPLPKCTGLFYTTSPYLVFCRNWTFFTQFFHDLYSFTQFCSSKQW